MSAEIVVEIPAGCDHWATDAQARTWEAWDALADGWVERSWWCDANSKPCPADTPGARHHVHKQSTDGHRINVYPPSTPRPEVQS